MDTRRYLLGDMDGRLYMIHLLPQEDKISRPAPSTSRDTAHSSSRIDAIRIEFLGRLFILLESHIVIYIRIHQCKVPPKIILLSFSDVVVY